MPASQETIQLVLLLAEALAEPPDWLKKSGRQWPLFEAALTVINTTQASHLEDVLTAMATIPAESIGRRRVRYQNLLTLRNMHLHESLAVDGRLSGSLTFSVWNLYRSVGLMIPDAVLPDHVSVELAFIAHMMQQELNSPEEASQWCKARHLFVKQHAGQWLPSLGKALTRSGDPVYRPVGMLLEAIIIHELWLPTRKPKSAERKLPQLSESTLCNLCSFCVQTCPTQALAISETHDSTSLVINDAECVSCTKCVKICPTAVMQLAPAQAGAAGRILFQSPRAKCPGCDQPTVSQAEIDAIAEQIGRPRWLDYCPECRIIMMETTR